MKTKLRHIRAVETAIGPIRPNGQPATHAEIEAMRANYRHAVRCGANVGSIKDYAERAGWRWI